MKEKIYFIGGMHCASCELLIEKRVLQEKGVKVADASLGKNALRIEYEGNAPHVNELNGWFKNDGYTFSETKPQPKKQPLFYVQKGQQGIRLDRKLLRKKLGTLARVWLVFFALYLIEKTGAATYVNVSDNSSLGIFFLFGLVAGLSSCAALVGGILLSLTKQWNGQYGYDAPTRKKMIPHFFFHGGRLFAYGLFGALLGALGKAIALEQVTLYALITLLVSFVMLMIGLQMAGVTWAERFQIRMPKIVTRRIAGSEGKKGNQLPFAIGAGTVLLPCGFTLIAQGVALTSGSATRGALILLFFVLGTMIPLLGIGLVSVRGTANPNRARVFSFYAGVVLIIFALYNVNGQLNVLGLPSVSDVLAKDAANENVEVEEPANTTGEQQVTMVAKGFSYTLTSQSTIRPGIPTKLIVNNQGIQGCGAFLSARGLKSGFVQLQPGKNVIDLGKPKKGTYKITCSMGMVAPVTIRVQ